VLEVNGGLGDMLAVGSVLVWLGDAPDEKVAAEAKPVGTPAASPAWRSGGSLHQQNEPTLKALLLAKHYGVDLAEVAASNGQLTAEDVRRHAMSRQKRDSGPDLPGRPEPLTPEQRGMLRTVSWQREHATPGYLEIEYDPRPWQEFGASFQTSRGLWFDPALSLMAWRLAQLAAERPRINATVSGASAHVYDDVNLGFTVQAKSTLYLVVVKGAQRMTADEFVRELGALQLAAMRETLEAEQTSGATVSFSSMARWKVTRHMPVLPPQTSLIVAHTAAKDGAAQLGATYDHRLLTGYDAVQILQALAQPPAQA
jgi:pyruvate/2-oxoglutarate dehydrogenase complex dihydrolipoamide acyltransferase (E2) component